MKNAMYMKDNVTISKSILGYFFLILYQSMFMEYIILSFINFIVILYFLLYDRISEELLNFEIEENN